MGHAVNTNYSDRFNCRRRPIFVTHLRCVNMHLRSIIRLPVKILQIILYLTLKCIDFSLVYLYNLQLDWINYSGNNLNEVYHLMTQDKTLNCKDCGEEFMFSASEQDFYAEKGFTNEPQRCKPCRQARKNGGVQREMFSATCAECGGEAKVPFQPRDDRPVYCSDCFSRQR